MIGITRGDLPIALKEAGLELRFCPVGNMILSFYQIPKSTDFASLLRGLPEDMCQCPHWGYLVKGKMLVHTKTGEEIVETRQAFYMPPGHVPEFLEDCELFEFAPMAEFKEMMEHVMRQTSISTA
jgi:hypothetical protein